MSSAEINSEYEGVMIISCGSLTPENIVCKILGVESTPETVLSNSSFDGYLWSFKTKYYSSKINLFTMKEKTELDSSFCDKIKAMIFYFDSEKESSFEDILSWIPFLKNINAEVQLLICNHCLDESDKQVLERKNILKWCIENQYELVELNPPPESDEEDEEAFKGAKGFDRVVEALQSYTWDNLVMADATGETESLACGGDKENLNETSSGAEKDGSKTMNVEGVELELEEKWLTNVLKGEDPGGESFEALFSKFASMKDKAEGLSGNDRRKYAEKVAVAFWRAMGGDEDEIEGLDDSDVE